jgi:tetratricopeptide (TPR) repeat protein
MKKSLLILFVLVSNLAYSQKGTNQTAFEGEKAYLKLEDSPDIRKYSEIIARDSLNAESYFNRAKGFYSIWRKGNNWDTVVFRHFKNDLFKANMLDSSNCNYNSWIANRCRLPDSISIIYYNKAIKNCSNTEEYFFQRSFCLMRLRRFEDAIKDLNTAKSIRQIKGDEVTNRLMTEEYITYRGLCYAKMGEFKKAERDLRNVIESDTIKWDSYLYLGIIESMQGKNEEALDIYNDLKERAPFFIVNYIYIGNLYHVMGNESLANENWAFAEKNGIAVEEKRKPIDTQLDFFVDNFRLGSD